METTTMMRSTFCCALFLSCALLAGCGPVYELDAASLRGSLGSVEAFDEQVPEPYAYGDWDSSSFTLRAEADDGAWALARLTLPNDFVHWEPGIYDNTGDILGCSAIPGEIMYDRNADESQIQILEGGRVIYTGTWEDDDRTHRLTGEMTYVVLSE
jgi:hypothetical protein